MKEELFAKEPRSGGGIPSLALSASSDDEMSLLELADRLLNRGVVLTGEATISVAGVDLIYLGLNVVLSAVQNLKTSHAPPPSRGRDG
jgi:gas vesicle structural protein